MVFRHAGVRRFQKAKAKNQAALKRLSEAQKATPSSRSLVKVQSEKAGIAKGIARLEAKKARLEFRGEKARRGLFGTRYLRQVFWDWRAKKAGSRIDERQERLLFTRYKEDALKKALGAEQNVKIIGLGETHTVKNALLMKQMARMIRLLPKTGRALLKKASTLENLNAKRNVGIDAARLASLKAKISTLASASSAKSQQKAVVQLIDLEGQINTALKSVKAGNHAQAVSIVNSITA